ncbi:TPH1_2 [Mytilus edulis]|uniref:TPH1_2 n=1 Tax=Mytilus edulis TaxID=6550 RepID=A0A8S3UJ75_MYTED|nr:TPH1_2 [Mytilus edulis]
MTQESQQINEAVSNLQTKIDTLAEYKGQISSMIENATEVQTFLGLKEIDKKIVKEEENMSRMVVEPGMKETSVNMEFANEIGGLVEEIKLMGTLELNKVTTAMHYAGTKSQLAKREKNICSCAILADERVILLNNCPNETSGGLHIFIKNSEYQERVLCTSSPFGLAVMNKSEIAVSFCKEKSIKVYDSDKFTVKRVLIDGHYFRGLSCESECLISAVRDEDGNDFKIVLGIKDGVQCPKAVSYDVMQSILVVANGNGPAKKYKLSYI